MDRSQSFSDKLEHYPHVDLDSFKQWVVAFCIIRFDLELGQLIEESYPSGCLFHEEELDIAFSSFPDSISQNQNRSSVHDSIFFFRIPRRSSEKKNAASSQVVSGAGCFSLTSESKEEVCIGRNLSHNVSDGAKFLYGFVFNRQRHDERLKRGGEQKSVVILSHSPFPCVFRALLQIMGPLFFDIGKKALENVAAYVSAWPAPVPGKLMDLPIGNTSLKIYLPPASCLHLGRGLFEQYASSVAPLLPTNQSVPQGLFHDADIFGVFRGILMQLWVLWELLLIGEPILVIGQSPSQCSEAVASIISLVAPLLCSVDYRPYFTIHDPLFSHLNSLHEGTAFPPLILGVTNLYFLKSLRNIPHVVSVGAPEHLPTRLSFAYRPDTGGSPGRPEGFGLKQLSLKKLSPSSLISSIKLRRDGPLCLMNEKKEAVWTNYTAITKPDTSILNRLIDAGMSPRVEESMSIVNNEILRRHFLELTTNFLAPFGPYFKATTPSEGTSPFVDSPPLRPFDIDEFLTSLSARGVGKFLSKRMRPNWLDLYKRFLDGPNFKPWFERRRAVSEQEQRKLWKHARIKADVQLFILKMSELEVVDSFNAIEKDLHEELQLLILQRRTNVLDNLPTIQKLKKDLKAVFNVLPKDTQQLLLMNPDRATLLQGIVES